MPPTKRTKYEAHYGPGRPPHGEYCEICLHYEPSAGEAPECEVVVGTVSWRGWCRFWKEASAAIKVRNRALRG